MQMRSRYTERWFQDRAIRSIKKIGQGVWDYSDSLLLYVSGSDEEYTSIQETESPYHRLVTAPERTYLRDVAVSIAERLPDNFDYIDLGPGTEHKEQFFFDALKEQEKSFTYIPVDISEKYLAESVSYAAGQGIATQPAQCSFEELPEFLGDATRPRFVSLGLTYSNYDPGIILPLLRKIAGQNGCIFVSSQLRERVEIESIRNMYAQDVQSIFHAKLRLVGMNPSVDVFDCWADDGIQSWCTVRHVSQTLGGLGVQEGDRLLMFQSLRPSKEQFMNDLRATGCTFETFDIDQQFLSALLKT